MERIEQEAMQKYLKEDSRSQGSSSIARSPGTFEGAADRSLRLAELEAKIKAARELPRGIAPPLLPGWRAQTNPDGRVYYVNENTGESRWDRPEDISARTTMPETVLPAEGLANSSSQAHLGGWQCGFSPEGVPYYYHVDRGVTQWEAPPEWVQSCGAVDQGQGGGALATGASHFAAHNSTATESAWFVADAKPAEHQEANESGGVAQEPESSDVSTPAVDIDEATGLGKWTVVEPSESSAAVKEAKHRTKRQRGNEVSVDDDYVDDRHDVVEHVKTHYAVPEIIRKAAEAADTNDDSGTSGGAVVFKKRTKGKAGLRISKAGLS